MARKYHPDVSKEPNAEERFKEVQAAWEAIKNPQSQSRAWGAGASQGRAHSWTSEHFDEILRGFRDWGFGEARFDRTMNISVTLEQAFTGAVHNIGGVRVQLPPGVRTGARVRLRPGVRTGARVRLSPELSVVVTVLPHRRFQRNGDDLLLNLHVGVAEAVLGCAVRVQTLMGNTLEVKVPGGIQNGQTVRLRGQGMPNPADANHRGDLFLQVFVDTPKPESLTDEQREFLENNFNYQRTRDA